MPLIPTVTTFNHEDSLVNKVQDTVKRTTDGILANPLVNGILLTAVTLKAGSTVVDHKLGRACRGWYLVSPKGPYVVWETKRDNSSLTLSYLYLNSAGLALTAAGPLTVTQDPTNAIITKDSTASIVVDLFVF